MGKSNHGGTRPGAGRPKKPPTVTLAFRVPKEKADQLKNQIKQLIKSQSHDTAKQD
jgi:hypothetical protein